MVMFFGVVVEQGPCEEVISHPRHPYTYLLLEAVPVPNPRLRRLRLGDAKTAVANRVEAAPSAKGCIFSNRCPYAEPRCFAERPMLQDLAPSHQAACWFPERVPNLLATLEGSSSGLGRSWLGASAEVYRAGSP
jgi:oligopeptide/dipeptide ABC transporter ATP-binding protein